MTYLGDEVIGFRLCYVGHLIFNWSYVFVDLHTAVQAVDSFNSEVKFFIGTDSGFSLVNG